LFKVRTVFATVAVAKNWLDLACRGAQVALQLAAADRCILVADVIDDDVGPADAAAGAVDGRENLLVDAVIPADLGQIAEDPHLVEQAETNALGTTSRRAELRQPNGTATLPSLSTWTDYPHGPLHARRRVCRIGQFAEKNAPFANSRDAVSPYTNCCSGKTAGLLQKKCVRRVGGEPRSLSKPLVPTRKGLFKGASIGSPSPAPRLPSGRSAVKLIGRSSSPTL